MSIHGTKEITTDRLLLRKYISEDAAVLFRDFGSDEAMYKYSGWNPYASEKMAEETVRRFIDSYQDEYFYGWAVIFEDTFSGTAGAYDYDPETDTIEIGISIARRFWGRGLASETLKAVIRHLSEEDGISCVTAWCAADNKGSMKAMENAGMKHIRTEQGALAIDGKVYDRLIYEYRK